MKIATLGPERTFSDLAARQYLKDCSLDCSISYYPTIKNVFNSIGSECALGVLPIENMSEGYVQMTLDLLINSELSIIAELRLPVKFAFVGKTDSLDKIEKVYVQYVTRGQCHEFLDQFDLESIIQTQSNIQSLNLLLEGEENCGAIVPCHVLEEHDSYPLEIKNITDTNHNETRFIVLGPDEAPYEAGKKYKTSLIILDDVDRPGLLSEILNIFTERKINITALMSRPTRESLGNYHFFIDIDGHHLENDIQKALDEIQASHTVKIIGSYLKA